ncbi:MAG: peptidoglycan-binding domain-containing protein [Candidatus Gygaella obscura]|nr:peptidoglycan-binding domain-containing protein [Candidatus Gygaella obscura]
MRIFITIFLPALLLLCGCSTSSNRANIKQIEHLQVTVQSLEKTVAEKDKIISDLGKEIDQIDSEKKKLVRKVDYRLTSKNIQKALLNVGLYKGKVDGKIGPSTKKAIISFQKANGLVADGIVGKKTWLKLKDYL